MVKGGTKRKATMAKITKRESAATTFTKRSYGLHSKIAQLCLLTDAQIAVLATPSSANSNVSFYSFGHSSVDSIVNAFLTGKRPVREERDDKEDLGICLARKELGLPQWWEDDRLLKSKDPQELAHAINSMSRLLTKTKELLAEDVEPPPTKKTKKNNNEETMKTTEQQTLVLPSGSSEEDGKTLGCNDNVMTEEEELDRIMSTCDSYCLPHDNNDSFEINFDQLDDLDFSFDFETNNSEDEQPPPPLKMAEPAAQPPTLPSDCYTGDDAFPAGLGYETDIHQLIDFDGLLSASNDGFMETNTIQEQLQEETSTCAMNSVDGDDASALSEEDTSFSDYLTQFLQS